MKETLMLPPKTGKAGVYLADSTVSVPARLSTKDQSTPIIGPCYSTYNHADMLNFFTHAKTTNTLPAVVVWHELQNDSYLNIQAHNVVFGGDSGNNECHMTTP